MFIASQPALATSAGSSFLACPTLVSSSSARWKNSVSVAPGLRQVTVTPLSLISSFERRGEAVDERLRAVVDRLERAGHVPGDRAGDQHPALAALDHPLHDRLDQQQGAGDVGVDDVLPLVGALVEEAVAEAMAGIGDQHVDRAVADCGEQLVDALLRRQVSLDLLAPRRRVP